MVLEKDPWYVRLFDIRLRKVYLCVYLFVKTLLGPCRILEAYYSGDIVGGYLKTEKFQIAAENQSEAERFPYAVIKGRK